MSPAEDGIIAITAGTLKSPGSSAGCEWEHHVRYNRGQEEHMARVPQTSEAYKRYLRKFDDQETEIEKRRAKIDALQADIDRQRKDYEGFILSLNVG